MASQKLVVTDENAAALRLRATWQGSKVTEAHLEWLRKSRRVPLEVDCRLPPSGEISPVPLAGERVVFISHFQRGFGLPASDFFRAFLDKFGLQPHHLPANALLFLSSFASLFEG